MRVAIHQPEHMPWCGFFHKMAQADTFVILDCVQFAKQNWQNRNQFCTPKGDPYFLTVPVKTEGFLHSTIRDIKISYNTNWQRKYWNTLEQNYCKAPFFNLYAPEIKAILDTKPVFLWQLNIALIHLFRTFLGLRNTLILASELQPIGSQSELLFDICKKLNASIYLSGQGGKKYLNIELFTKDGIEVTFDHYPAHGQLNFSFAHTLFHYGPEAKKQIGMYYETSLKQ